MQTKIVKMLYNADGYVSGQEISDTLGVSRQAVNKAVNALREKGFVIDSVTRRGYLLSKLPTELCEEAVSCHLNTRLIGKKIIVLDTVDSTNNYLKKLASNGEESGTVAASTEQTAGKGRLGRVWQTKKGEGLAFSVLLRPRLSPNEIGGITPLAGLAVCRAINDFCGLDSRIKWPNDVIVGSKKLVGILTEMSTDFDTVEHIVIGIGINVSHTSFPEEIAHKATSLLLETGKKPDINRFFATVLNYLEDELLTNNFTLGGQAVGEYQRLCATIGRQVSFTRGRRQISATAVSVSDSGELEVMLENGTVATVNSGEVTVQGIY
ncbi:MAG: biotin--[Ruminococcus sp.]|nr:biotin--[acetyl-CoA-carboxylase] ligase [Ruminococcus sp.]